MLFSSIGQTLAYFLPPHLTSFASSSPTSFKELVLSQGAPFYGSFYLSHIEELEVGGPSTGKSSSSNLAPLSHVGADDSIPVPTEFTTKMDFNCVIVGRISLSLYQGDYY